MNMNDRDTVMFLLGIVALIIGCFIAAWWWVGA